jgi:hypothetical protein
MANFELRLDGRTVAKIDIDTETLRGLLGVGSAPAAAVAEAPHKSVTLTQAQAHELIERAGKVMAPFLKRFAEEHGAVTWGETKQTFGVKSFEEFVEGPLKKLDKAVHKLTGVETPLIWRVEHEWIGLEKGEDEVCRLHIDGPALAALKATFD